MTETQRAELRRLSRSVHQVPELAVNISPRERFRQGLCPSSYKGEGVEFVDSRRYQVGDDVRKINWKAFARKAGPPELMQFRLERQLTMKVVCCIAGSMRYGTQEFNLAELAAVLCGSILRTGERAGASGWFRTYGDGKAVHKVGPGQGGDACRRWQVCLLNAITQNLEDLSYSGAGLEPSLRSLPRKPGMLFVVSDFRHLDVADQKALRKLAVYNEVICIRVTDLRERELPEVELPRMLRWLPQATALEVRDASGANRNIVVTAATRKQHADEFDAENRRLGELFAGMRCTFATFGTEESNHRRHCKLIRLLSGKRRHGLMDLGDQPKNTHHHSSERS